MDSDRAWLAASAVSQRKANRRSLRSGLVAASALAFAAFAPSAASAATVYWDGAVPAGAPGGGAGTWDTSTTNWDTSVTGGDTAWVNANNDTAVFGGTAGIVTVGTNITVGGLRFDTSAYTISNGVNTLTFGATDNTILFYNGNNATMAATINSTVSGTGNVIISNAANHATQLLGTLTLNGTSTGGWSGSTTINSGMTLALTGFNQALKNTSSITLNGGYSGTTQTGGITLTNANSSEAAIDRVNNSAAIISNGGFITVTNSGATTYSETMGALDLRRGQLNVTQTNTTGTQTLTFGSGSLTTVNGSARTNATTSAINFSGASLGTSGNSIIITGQATTNSGEIIAPWATYANTANAQNDYAVYNRAGSGGATNALGVQGANIAASAQSTWSTTYAATSNYSLTNAAGTGTQLAATRSINTLRNTGGTAQNITSITSNVLTITGSTYANGDTVVTGTTFPTGLTRETVYYVVNAGISGAGTFQLAATPGGSAITGLTHVASSPLTGGITLSSGKNLETYGILNGSGTALPIGGATSAGTLSTPSGGGNLYLTTGAGSIVINAPITNSSDNAAVTVVKSGGGLLVLSGNNTFTGGLVINGGAAGGVVRLVGTQSFTGGITLNGGGIGDNAVNGVPAVAASSLNGNAITVNGPSHLMITSDSDNTLATSSTITINATGVLALGAGSASGGGGGTVNVPGVVSGSGVLNVDANNVNNKTVTVNLTNSANTFSGNVIFTCNNGTTNLNVNSIADTNKVIFGIGGTAASFGLSSTATSGLVLNTRQFEMAGTSATGKLANNSGYNFTVNTDLLTSGTGARTMQFGGTGSGLGIFAGKLADGSLTSLAVSRVDGGFWRFTGANTYTGTTTLTAGTLNLGVAENAGVSGPMGKQAANAAGTIVMNGGTLQFSAVNQFDYSGRFSTAGGQSWNIDTNNQNVTFATTLQGATSSLNKSGFGNLTLSGATNSYGGATSLTAGGLVLDYTTNDNTKLADGAALSLTSGTLTLKGGSHTETVVSTTLNTGASVYVARNGGTAKLRLNAITRSNNGQISFAEANLADTDTLNAVNTNTLGIMGGWATVGSDWAVSASSGTDINITAFSSYNALPTSGGGLTTASNNYQVTGDQIQGGNTSVVSLRIANSANSQTLEIGSSNLSVYSFNATSLGGILYAGGSDNKYTINGTGGGRIVSSTANREILINTYTGTLTVNALIGDAGAGRFTKAGAGTLVLTAANDYTGQTRVADGTLLINGSLASASAVTVHTGATLGGTGTVGGTVLLTAGANLAPGSGGVGTLNTGAFTGNRTAALVCEVNSTANTMDQLNVTGTVNLNGVDLVLSELNGLVAGYTQTFTLINNDGSDAVAGTFGNLTGLLNNTYVSGAMIGTVNYAGGTGNDVTITFTSVPEPTSLSLLGLGGMGLLKRRRRR